MTLPLSRRSFIWRVLLAIVGALAIFRVPRLREAVTTVKLTFPLRVAFVYPWYPETTTGHYTPDGGLYDSSDPAVIERQTQQLHYARVRLGVASWWGPQGSGTNHHEDTRIPALLDAAAASKWPLTWCAYFERADTADDQTVKDWLTYLGRYTSHPRWAHKDGKPLILLYNTSGGEALTDRWSSLASNWFWIPKIFDGWRDVSPQPSAWHQYGPSTHFQQHADATGHVVSAAVSPGFWKGDESSPRLARDPVRFAQDVDLQVASRADLQLVTTFNELGEGTGVEPTSEWGRTYLEILHDRPYRSR